MQKAQTDKFLIKKNILLSQETGKEIETYAKLIFQSKQSNIIEITNDEQETTKIELFDDQEKITISMFSIINNFDIENATLQELTLSQKLLIWDQLKTEINSELIRIENKIKELTDIIFHYKNISSLMLGEDLSPITICQLSDKSIKIVSNNKLINIEDITIHDKIDIWEKLKEIAAKNKIS